jgi:hypothetical protein
VLTIWLLRLLVVVALVLLCVAAGSYAPAFAVTLVWGMTGLTFWAFLIGALRLPRFLLPVGRLEPAIYRRLGVGFVKKLVATRTWPVLNGFPPPEKLAGDQEALDRAEFTMQGAEVCHGAAFLLVLPVALFFLVNGRTAEVMWILAFNILLHAYPVMLQRSNRWRVQKVRQRRQVPGAEG